MTIMQEIHAQKVRDAREDIALCDEQIAMYREFIRELEQRRDERRARLVALGATGDLT